MIKRDVLARESSVRIEDEEGSDIRRATNVKSFVIVLSVQKRAEVENRKQGPFFIQMSYNIKPKV